jgi:hypothetical protein
MVHEWGLWAVARQTLLKGARENLASNSTLHPNATNRRQALARKLEMHNSARHGPWSDGKTISPSVSRNVIQAPVILRVGLLRGVHSP